MWTEPVTAREVFFRIGVPDAQGVPWDPAKLKDHPHICFGTAFAESAAECKVCTAPILVDGSIVLYREACKAAALGCSIALKPLRRLSMSEVAARLEEGREVLDVWREILNGNDPRIKGREARSLLTQRLRELVKGAGKDGGPIPRVPEIPTTQELTNALHRVERS
jgi:hypothetical protein